jgi:hypothetical protein
VTAITATVNVRTYDGTKNAMYRVEPWGHSFAGHPIESGFITSWAKVGPLALRCMNCHQVHNATAQIWRPQAYNAAQGATETVSGTTVLKYGYNLLKRYPSGSANTNGMTGLTTDMLVKVPETTLSSVNTPVSSAIAQNYSNTGSAAGQYYEVGVTSAQPLWVMNELADTGYTSVVNNLTLSVWCGDCHNLNVGSSTGVVAELGARSHAERTHPVPFAHGGQCYSCHRADLGIPAGGVPATSGCSRCHYPSSSYVTDKPTSDFPHAGGADSIKLLGAYSITPPNVTQSFTYTPVATNITANNLDAVCIRCHTSTGVHN